MPSAFSWLMEDIWQEQDLIIWKNEVRIISGYSLVLLTESGFLNIWIIHCNARGFCHTLWRLSLTFNLSKTQKPHDSGVLPVISVKCNNCQMEFDVFCWKVPSFEAREAHLYLNNWLGKGAAAYQLGNTSSRTITEVKQRWAQLVLGWDTVQVLPECCC